VDEQSITLSGAGDYDVPKLESQTPTVLVNGAGNAAPWAADTLEARISGLGNVKYYGSPTVTKEVGGAGKITNLGGR